MNRKNQPLPIDRSQVDLAQGDMILRAIAHVESDFSEKFGIPRQSGLVPELTGRIIFAPEFRQMRAVKGLEGYSHLWLIWQFSEAVRPVWTPMVRPPRLGGDTYMGVFATRSPFRPNPIGLSCVRLLQIREEEALGPVLEIAGADLMDGTPIYDIKPYLPYADAYPQARGGFTDQVARQILRVHFPGELLCLLPEEKHSAVLGVLAQDPRPSYQKDPERVYGISFGGFNIRFQVRGGELTVTEVERVF